MLSLPVLPLPIAPSEPLCWKPHRATIVSVHRGQQLPGRALAHSSKIAETLKSYGSIAVLESDGVFKVDTRQRLDVFRLVSHEILDPRVKYPLSLFWLQCKSSGLTFSGETHPNLA